MIIGVTPEGAFTLYKETRNKIMKTPKHLRRTKRQNPVNATTAAPASGQGFTITLDRPSHMYRLNEDAKFTFTGNGKVKMQYSMDTERILKEKRLTLVPSSPVTMKYRLKEPGFLRCRLFSTDVDSTLLAEAGVAFEPERIIPILPEPPDFDEFWEREKAALDSIPENVRIMRKTEYSNSKSLFYQVSIANFNKTRIHGFLVIPKAKGPHPILVNISGYGYGPIASQCRSWIDENWDTFHGYAVLMIRVQRYPPARTFEEAQEQHEKYIESIGGRHYYTDGIVERDIANSFLRRAILGCRRLLLWTLRRPDIDPSRVVYYGASQGGDFGLWLAGLDSGLTAVFAGVPGAGDCGGFKIGRHPSPVHIPQMRENLDILEYFDLVHFAKRIWIPAMITAGFIDNCCFPSSIYPVYQALRGERIMLNMPTCGHGGSPEYNKFSIAWVRWKLEKE